MAASSDFPWSQPGSDQQTQGQTDQTPEQQIAHQIAQARTPVAVDETWRRFRLRTAQNEADIATALRLRHDVFHLEMLGRPSPTGTDVDDFDFVCDQLLICDAESDAILGTSRFNSSQRPGECYSATEFAIDPFLAWDGIKVEMGRTCIHKDHRSSLTLAALGKGLGMYCRAVDARWMFGCSSISATDVPSVANLCRYLVAKDLTLPSEVAVPHAHHRLAGLDQALAHSAPVDEAAAEAIIPPLLRSYLRAGAKVSQAPSHDPDFACVDFLTVLDLEASNDRFMGRYVAE